MSISSDRHLSRPTVIVGAVGLPASLPLLLVALHHLGPSHVGQVRISTGVT
jgi:hypothetical protein